MSGQRNNGWQIYRRVGKACGEMKMTRVVCVDAGDMEEGGGGGWKSGQEKELWAVDM